MHYLTGAVRRNKYSGKPQLTPIQNVAGIAINALQFRLVATSAKIQTVRAAADIAKSQNNPVEA